MKKALFYLAISLFLVISSGSQYLSAQEMAFVETSSNEPTNNAKSSRQQKADLEEVLKTLQKEFRVFFTYSDELVKNKKVVFQPNPDKDLDKILVEVLFPIGLQHRKVRGKTYVITRKQTSSTPLKQKNTTGKSNPTEIFHRQQMSPLRPLSSNQRTYVHPFQFPVSGTVTDMDGLPLIGVNILVKGTTRGAVTDLDGNFSLDLSNGEEVLVFSYTGYEPQEVAVNGRSILQITMSESVSQLNEIVVIGYGTQKKSDLTGAVSQVKAKDINAFPATNVMQSLSGRAPGVQVLQTTGAPGAAVDIRIRGTNSIQGGNEPLYVIDGFPFSGTPTNLNNSDIESIEILKDASATAIYGSRGANGVVLITTKQGKAGRTTVDFESSYSTQRLRNKLELMNGREYATLANEQAANDNVNPYFSQAEIDGFGEGFDWQDLVFQKAPIQTTSLNVSGGNEKTQFAVAGSFFGQDGIVKGSDYNRYSLRANFNHNISEKFSINLSNTLSYLNTKRRDSAGGSRGNSMIAAAIAAAPISTPYNEDGSYRVLANEYPFVAPDIINPLNFINEQQNEIKANVVLTNAALIYEPIPELTIKISGGIENRDDRSDSYTTRNFFNSNGSARVNASQFRSLLSENTISYNKTFNERHRVSAVAGFTYQDFTSTSLTAGGIGFLSDAFQTYDLEASENPGIPASGYSKATLLSYLGRVNYSLNNKYLFTFSFRSDGSSRYSAGNKWGYFPSGAVAWRVIDETFIKEMNLFSDLKLRASWGLTGSQAINPYATLNLLSAGLTVFDDQLYNTFAPGTRLPGDLRWETTEQIDIGLDFGLFNNRLFVTADYYVKNTRDLLNTVRLPNSMGFTSTVQNVGEVQNRGFELAVDGKIFTGRFKWDLNANISFNRNRVVRLHNGEDILAGRVSVLVIDDNVSILKEGEPIGLFWGYLEDGYDEQGLIKITDLDGSGSINANDKTRIGDPNPDFIYGLNSSMSYKNFELNLFIQGSYGNDIFNASAIPVTLDYGQGLNMPREVFYDHWTPANTNAKYPVISRKVSGYASDRWIEDGSFLRLRNIELAYNIAFEKLGVSWIRNAKLYVSGQNLITLTQYSWWDPEVNSRGAGLSQGIDHFTYPIAKTFTVGSEPASKIGEAERSIDIAKILKSMNMKSIINSPKYSPAVLNLLIYMIPAAVFLSALTSCEALLEEEPKSVAAELFYNTADEVEAGVNAIYPPMRMNRAEYIAVLDAHTDWGYGRGSRANYNDFAGFNSGNINVAAGRWNAFYQSIRNANLVINNAPGGTSIGQGDIDKYVAEAKFLRALAYFDLVRNWGGVPLRTEDNITEIDVPKSTPAQVFELIIADLLEAEKNLPETPDNIGRPTTYAAKTLLADAYLTLERFEEARDKANEVIQSGKFSLVPVSSIEDFQWNLFGPELLTTPEEIFYFKFTRQAGHGNWILFVLNHPSTGLFNFGGAYAHYSDASNKFYATWDDNDLRKALWDQIDFGLGTTTLVSKKYIEPNAVDRVGGGNDLPIYRYAEVLLIYAEATSRAAGGPTAEAMEALNQVHRRAYGQDANTPSAFDFKIEDYNADSFLDLVLRERAYEFQFEGKRWLDLKRTGKAAETIMDVRGLQIAEKHYLWPIPPDELNFNGAMNPEDQNPGY